jgi:hypothetical protein
MIGVSPCDCPCLGCMVLSVVHNPGIRQRERGVGEIIWYLGWPGESWTISLPLLLCRVVPALEENILTSQSDYFEVIDYHWFTAVVVCWVVLISRTSSKKSDYVLRQRRYKKFLNAPNLLLLLLLDLLPLSSSMSSLSFFLSTPQPLELPHVCWFLMPPTSRPCCCLHLLSCCNLLSSCTSASYSPLPAPLDWQQLCLCFSATCWLLVLDLQVSTYLSEGENHWISSNSRQSYDAP